MPPITRSIANRNSKHNLLNWHSRKRPTATQRSNASKRSTKQPALRSKPTYKVPFLPNEIIMIIAQYIKPGHRGNFRLCCRSFAAIGLSYLLKDIIVYLHHESMNHLLGLISHPTCGEHVRSLHFEIDGLEEPAVSFEEYAQEIESRRQLTARSKYLASRNDRVTTGPLTRHGLERAYAIYRKTVLLQQSLISEGFLHHDLWTCAIRTFRNLDSITISSGFHFHQGEFRKDPYRHYCINAHEVMGDNVGVEEFEYILASAKLAGTKLRILRAGLLHWSAFANLCQDRLRLLISPLQHLTQLYLVLHTGTDDESDAAGFESEECYSHLMEGGLRRFTRGLPKLQTLSIEFDSYDEANFEFPADSAMILDPDHHWPDLRQLEFSCIEINESHMASFFKKHRESLETFYLTNVTFSMSMKVFFSHVRDILRLQDIGVYGNLFGVEDEDDGWVDEQWFMRWPEQKSKVRDALKDFVLNWGEYPLTWDRVQELEAEDEPDIYEQMKIRWAKMRPEIK
jgi:hypothetical protein